MSSVTFCIETRRPRDRYRAHGGRCSRQIDDRSAPVPEPMDVVVHTRIAQNPALATSTRRAYIGAMSEERTNRRLAAVLAADVVGYSKMMAADEAGTLAALRSHREILFDPAVERHHGRIVKLMGDGTLVEFSSVVDAVKCALDIQLRAAEQQSGDSAITLRIGVNLGDVIIDGDDI